MEHSSGDGSSGSPRCRAADARLAAVIFLLTLSIASWIGVTLSTSSQVARASRLADGEAPTEGGPWNAVESAALRSPNAAAVVDLGGEQHDVRIFLQADADDTYRIESSPDGRRYEVAWDAGPVTGGGLRSRASEPIAQLGRYLRIRPVKGDGLYSVGELSVAPAPGLTPPWRWVGGTSTSSLRTAWWALAGVGLVIILLAASLGSGLVRATGMVLGAVAGAVGAGMVHSLGPIEMKDELILGSLAATVAMLALRLERTPRGARSRVSLTALAVVSALSFGAFFHYGAGQFPDARDGSRTRIHYADLRNYFPTAKYFDELGYSGVYRASVLTWVAAAAEGNLDAARSVAYRDLDTHRMTVAAFDRPGLEALRQRFSAERFEALRADMEYLRAIMGDELYAGSMIDHGGNATPLWLAVARLLFAGQPASDTLFELTGLLDVASMLLLLFCVGRAYGTRSALVVGLVFGATEFPNIANNWAGATLRHDWLVAFGLGLCALRAQRFALGGGLLSWSAGIRAFPALGLTMAAAALGLRWWFARRSGDPTAPKRARAAKRFVIGAAVCTALVTTSSILALDAGAWPDWLRKVRLLSAEPHLNHIGLPTFVFHFQEAMKMGRAPGLIPILGLAMSLLVLPFALARGLRSEGRDAGLWGLLLVPFFSNPANYYGHFVCLVPLLGASRHPDSALAPAGWIMLIHAACTALLFAGSPHDAGHFELLSLVYVVTVGALLVAPRIAAAWSSDAVALDLRPNGSILVPTRGSPSGDPPPTR